MPADPDMIVAAVDPGENIIDCLVWQPLVARVFENSAKAVDVARQSEPVENVYPSLCHAPP